MRSSVDTRARVAAAMATVDRAAFLPADQRPYAGEDRPLPIGHGQTNSQPRTVRDMLELLDVHPGHRVLDVGAGSGWTTALLAALAGVEGSVIGTEAREDVRAFGLANLAAAHVVGARIELARADRLGWPQDAPYDRILVSASASTEPQDLLEQLAEGGRMVVPVGSRMREYRRGADGRLSWSGHGEYVFVPLAEPGR